MEPGRDGRRFVSEDLELCSALTGKGQLIRHAALGRYSGLLVSTRAGEPCPLPPPVTVKSLLH